YPASHSRSDGVVIGEDLSREINRAWIGIASRSVFDCLLMKYLEIPASFTVVAGNIPEHGRALFGENFIELGMEQSDREILATLKAHLADKDRLRAMADTVHQCVMFEWSTDAFADRVLDHFRQLVAKRT